MADTVNPQKRSWIMSRVRSAGNRSTELAFAEHLRRCGMTGWRRRYPLLGQPDFVFPKARLAVFVDGCFWHGCPAHCRIPKTNRRFWREKVARNVRRDKQTSRRLRALGWHVFRFWEHEMRQKTVNRKLGRMRRLLGENG